jgi:hypothetical protein
LSFAYFTPSIAELVLNKGLSVAYALHTIWSTPLRLNLQDFSQPRHFPMELQSMQCSPQFTVFHHEDSDPERCDSGTGDEAHLYSSAESSSRIRRPLWDDYIHRGTRAEQEAEEDDYTWYYKHPERYIWRPRTRRQVRSNEGKDERQSKALDLPVLLNIGRDSWF